MNPIYTTTIFELDNLFGPATKETKMMETPVAKHFADSHPELGNFEHGMMVFISGDR